MPASPSHRGVGGHGHGAIDGTLHQRASGSHALHIVHLRELADMSASLQTSTLPWRVQLVTTCVAAAMRFVELVAWRRMDTVAFVRQLLPRVKGGALVPVDEGGATLWRRLLAVPAARSGLISELVVVRSQVLPGGGAAAP